MVSHPERLRWTFPYGFYPARSFHAVQFFCLARLHSNWEFGRRALQAVKSHREAALSSAKPSARHEALLRHVRSSEVQEALATLKPRRAQLSEVAERMGQGFVVGTLATAWASLPMVVVDTAYGFQGA